MRSRINQLAYSKYKMDFPQESIFNTETLQKVTLVITFHERRTYDEIRY